MPITRKIKKLQYTFMKSIVVGIGFALGFLSVNLLAVTVSGAFNTFFSGQILKASEVNANFSILRTAIESIPDWVKSGADAVFSGGSLIIGTGTKANNAKITVNGSISSSILGIYCGNTLTVGTTGSFVGGITNGLVSYAGFTGYVGAKKACETACGNSNAHMCTSHEITISRQMNMSFPNIDMWYSAGDFSVDQSPGLTYNDCDSWQSNLSGSIGNIVCSSGATCTPTGRLYAEACNLQNAMACCL